jgi:TRAP transporter TAXI family solute receptor
MLLCALLAVAGTGCTRGPDEAGVARDVQARLDTLFGRQVLELQTLRRQGSAPVAAASDGRKRAIIYYNAKLRFTEAYDPSNWEGLSPQLIATALGAADEGVIGLQAGEIRPGSTLRAYGSLVYVKGDDSWQPTDVRATVAPGAIPTQARSRSRADELIARLAQIVDKNPRSHDAGSDIVAEELDRALQNISLRLDRGAGGSLVIAAGPAGGEYSRFLESVRAKVKATGPFTVSNTEGSVANAFMIDSGKARFGLVQSDVAAAAVTGEGMFSGAGPLRHLRAVASLFPEPVHVVVRADADVASLRDLTGRRISTGNAGSGTRHTAMSVLAAHGLEPGSYVDATARSPAEALAQLADGKLDAVIEVVAAPWTELADAANLVPLRLLSLDADVIPRIDAAVHGLVPLPIAPRTYRGQDAEIRTVSATALLVASDTVPASTVTATLELLFAGSGAPGRGVSASRLSQQRARDGITIPLHEGAATYFAK